jgi:hypothetical protein
VGEGVEAGELLMVYFRGVGQPPCPHPSVTEAISGVPCLLASCFSRASTAKSLEMNRSHPVTAATGEPVRRSARSSDPVGWTAAAVQIFDFDHRWLATGRASVYWSLKGKAEPLLEPAPGKQARDIRRIPGDTQEY